MGKFRGGRGTTQHTGRNPVSHNQVAVALAKQLGFSQQRTLTRMFLGENIPGLPENIWALAAPEIG